MFGAKVSHTVQRIWEFGVCFMLLISQQVKQSQIHKGTFCNFIILQYLLSDNPGCKRRSGSFNLFKACSRCDVPEKFLSLSETHFSPFVSISRLYFLPFFFFFLGYVIIHLNFRQEDYYNPTTYLDSIG